MKYININMDRFQYEGHDYLSYSLDTEKVRNIILNGDIPEITLNEKNANKPVIAVLLGKWKNPKKKEKDYFITPFYVEAIKNSGGYPVFISFEHIQEQLTHFNPNGILLIGGSYDVPPEFYINPDYEETDFTIHNAYQNVIKYAKEKALPILGICGGEQALAMFLGAKLIKNINDIPNNMNHKQLGAKLAHEIHVDKQSKFFDIVKLSDFMTTSVHRIAVSPKNIGDNIKVVAKTEDGVVEAIEGINIWNDFVIGVQYHPERFATLGDKPSINLFNGFINASKERIR